MDFESIYKREYESCNCFVAKACAMVLAFFGLVGILNIAGIFVVEKSAMIITAISTTLLFGGPIVLYFYYRNKKIKDLQYAYISAILILLNIMILYSFLTFHVIILFMFPVIVFNIYGNKPLIKKVMFGTLIVMVISHIASYYLGVNPEEPFTNMRDIIVYGLVPRLIIYVAFIYAFIFETNHNYIMLRGIFNYSRDMYHTQEELIKAFAEMCESKSGQTGQHVKRVSLYMKAMADELGIKGNEKECLVIASMMHDVGKLNIPSEILDKPGKLTDEEYEIIKKHTVYGYELLKNSPGRTMQIAAQIALNHHERWDGNGYAHVKGEDIDYYSRIMSIADVFDALVSKRSYKSAWSTDDAYNEIVSQAGKQFDPELIKTFTKVYPEFVKIHDSMPD